MVIFSGLFKVILDVLLSYLKTIELNILVYHSVNVCTATQHLRHSASIEVKKFIIFQLFKCTYM